MSFRHSALEELAKDSFIVDWVAAASMTCLVYDHIITFDEEVLRMWPARLSVPKILFFLNRYVVEGILIFSTVASANENLDIRFCVFFLRWYCIVITITNTIVEGILVARVRAIYQENKTAVVVALFFYIGNMTTLIALNIYTYAQEIVTTLNHFSGLPGCFANSLPKHIAGYWIAPMIVESVFFAMIVFKCWKFSRDTRTPRALVLLARDSTIYFSVIFILLSANFFVFKYGSPFMALLLLTPTNVAGSIAGSRMLLNLRALLSAPTEIQTSSAKSILPRRRFSTGCGTRIKKFN